MAVDPSTFAEIETEFVDRILALNDVGGVAAYSQGPGAAAKWKEATVPLTVLQDAGSLAHLLISVWIQNAPNADLDRDSYVDGYVWVDARLKVAFTYRLRPSKQVADARTATDAAIDIVRAMMATPDANKPCVLVRLVDALQTSLTLDGEYLLIVQDYTVGFDLRLDPTPTNIPP